MSDFNTQVIDAFRSNGGHVPNFGSSLVLVHHKGAKSGAERIAPVMSFKTDDGSWLIVASKGGAPENPAWYHNLLANPDTQIETPDGVVDVTATELDRATRDEEWKKITARAPGFAEYEKSTPRIIPVLKLSRR